MRYPPTGELATPLTAPMLEALWNLINNEPRPYNISNMATAVALLNRGFTMRAETGIPLSTQSMYYITMQGRKAYGINKRLSLGAQENHGNSGKA